MVSKRVRFARWWRRTGLEIRVLVFVIGVILLSLLVYLQRPEGEGAYAGSNLLVFTLLNVNICFILILGFLVARNIVKLVFDRRRNILGSRLRMRLVMAFVGIALVPVVLLYALASGLLNQAIEGWFNKQIEESVTGSVEIAREYYDSLGTSVKRTGQMVAAEVTPRPLIYKDPVLLRSYFQSMRVLHELFSIGAYTPAGVPIVVVSHTVSAIEDFKEPAPNASAIKRAFRQGGIVLREEKGSNQFIRAYIPFQYIQNEAILVVTLRVSPQTNELFRKIYDSYKGYEQIKFFKNPIRSGYLITLALIAGLILFSAVWFGFYIAREISVPIQRLAEGTEAVARGNYDFQVRAVGDDEIAFLVRSFNKMTSDLKQSRFDAERRRVLIETILANLAVGVIALDKNACITSVNSAGARMFGLGDPAQVRSKRIQDVIDSPVVDALMRVVQASEVAEAESLVQPEVELEVTTEGQRRKLIATAGYVATAEGLELGTVLIFDDITDLVQAQHMAAWREVARRIAHEIKNPLTPLQLCAQRLQRLLGDSHQATAVRESTETIVEHVASIKRLADEFSKFARMPTIQYEETNLSDLIAAVLSQYADSHPEIVFTYIADSNLTPVHVDKEQIRRAILNVIDNAVAALEEEPPASEGRSVTVKTQLTDEDQSVIVEIIDTGPGISHAQKNRIFEPYFTTREQGTGLGLAIVSSIISDHGGTIRVFDNAPRGTRFVIEFPTAPQETRQRKLAKSV